MSKLGEKLIAAAKEGVQIGQGAILPAGSFRVSDFRKAIPDWLKIVCAIRLLSRLDSPDILHFADLPKDQIIEGLGIPTLIEWVRSLRFDHRPPLQDRPFNLETNDFEPPQNDPDYIEAIPAKQHDTRTFGRKPGAEKTATTLGSDSWNRKHNRDIKNTQEIHELKLACKRGDPGAIARMLRVEKKAKPKKKWPSRPFPTRRKDAAA